MFKFSIFIKLITFFLFTNNLMAKEAEHVGMPQMSNNSIVISLLIV